MNYQDVPVDYFTAENLLNLRYLMRQVSGGLDIPTEIHISEQSMPGIHDMGVCPKPMPNVYGFTAVHMIIVNPQTWRDIEMRLRNEKDSLGQYYWQPSIEAGKPDTIAGIPIYDHT